MSQTVDCSGGDITTCPAAQVIKGLLIRLDQTDKFNKLQSEIVIALQHKQHAKSYIESAIDDVKTRLLWDIDSQCELYSRSKSVWTQGIITDIYTNEMTNVEWLVVKYGDNKKKEIQRFCSDLKPIGINDKDYEFKEDVMDYIRVKLKESQNSKGVQFMKSLSTVMDEYDYSATKLLDDFHHLKYGHGLNEDDTKFDAAFQFFTDSIIENECDVNQCHLMQRHYRDRGQPLLSRGVVDGDTVNDEVLMDIMAMVHCYFIHSFDLHRLTKAERETVEMESSYGTALDDEQKGDSENDDLWRTKLVADFLREKEQKLQLHRGNKRFRDEEYGQSTSEKMVDFTAMAQSVGVDEAVLREGLSEYEQNRDRLIGNLIDVVYDEDVHDVPIWKTLKVDEDQTRDIFRQILYDYFKCTQLSTENMIKSCNVTVQRMEFKIDIDPLNEVMTSNGIDGRIYDKTNPETYQNVNVFAQKFKSIPNGNGQHIRRMYNVVRKWKFIKSKKEKVVKKQKETVDDGKEDEKEPVVDDNDAVLIESNQRPEIYEIGKQFYFWDSLKGHPNYVKAKYGNMKEEVMHSPLLDGLVSVRAWNKLTKDIAAIIATEYALRITSNGISYNLYGIEQYEPLDAEHLRSLKLYTDFDKLCAAFCSILRWGDPRQIAEIAHLTRILVETVQCYGTRTSSIQTYYRGVNKTFLFRTVMTKFNLPWSTTISVE